MRRLIKLWHSPTLRTAVVYAASGLGFSGANLILARVLPTEEYALFTLAIALVNLAFALGPLGLDGVVNRRHLEAGPRLLHRTLAASCLVGLVFVAIAAVGYHMAPLVLLLLFLSTVAGGAMAVAGAQFQAEQRFGLSLFLTQSPNLSLLVAAVAVVLVHGHVASLPLAIATVGFVIAALCGWWILFRERHSKLTRETWFPWSEALSFAGLSTAGLLLIQLDRLIIPHVLPLEDLATYGVLAAIAGSLFRVLQMGVGYTLIPRLRAAGSVLERRRLITHEAKLVGAVVAAGSVFIWLVTPLVERLLLQDKYHLTGYLLLAAIISGVVKIMNSFTRATVTALATPGELSMVNVLGWFSVALAIPAAVFGARWGLAGVIYGVGFGWLLRALTGMYYTARHLNLPASIPVTAP
ncbi:MAG TPA: oligosaccharide flippase family protein [Gemmatimonadales bacterium]|nr:oligosaccharide flippase family protein [Gemmatimonadales bacterium]